MLLTDPSEIAKSLRDFLGDQRHPFTQWFAGWLRHPSIRCPGCERLRRRFPDEGALEGQLLARRVEQGGRLWLVKPNDPGVFLRSQSVQGFTLASDVQSIYLDLLVAGRRGDGAREQKELRKWTDFAGGWVL